MAETQVKPVPTGTLVMYQRWIDLLFLHWEWDPGAVQATLPPGLEVDTWRGTAWIGLVPFLMRGVRPRGLPAVPWLSDFHEMNVRTYVRDRHGRPGVWFYSLDCTQPVAVRIARAVFSLPYMDAAMSGSGPAGYECRRAGTRETTRLTYVAAGPERPAEEGTLEEFLVERYRLFAWKKPRLLTGEVWHTPYRISPVKWSGEPAPAMRQAGFDPQGRAPAHAVCASGVEVKVFGIEEV